MDPNNKQRQQCCGWGMCLSRIRDPGVKKVSDPGSGSATPNEREECHAFMMPYDLSPTLPPVSEYSPQSNELTSGPPELVQHFRL